MTLRVNSIIDDGDCVRNEWAFSLDKRSAPQGTLVDMQVWRKVSESSREQNRRILVWLVSRILHSTDSSHELPGLLHRWAIETERECEVGAMLRQDDRRSRAAAEFSRLLRQKGIEAEVYRVPDARAYELVLRVVFAYRPSLQERIMVGDTIGDLMDGYPELSVDIMTLNPHEFARCPLPECAVRAEQEGM